MVTVWSERLRISAHDADMNDVARPSAIQRLMQEAAVLEFYNCRPSVEELRRDYGMAYLVSRISMEIRKPLHAYEYVDAQSWACPSRFSTFIRCSQILQNGEVAARMHATWALVDVNTRHLLRVEDAPMNFGSAEAFTDMPTRLRMPHDLPFETVGHRTVTYHDCDVNRHMNNTRYADMLCDYLDMDGKMLTFLSLNYVHEAALGETVEIQRAPREDGGWYFRTVKPNSEFGIEADVKLADIAEMS